MKENSRQLLLVVLLALCLRLINLGGRPLWYDEAFSLLYARLAPEEMIAGTVGNGAAAAEEHPLLYYLALHGWTELWGDTPGLARLLTVLFGTATVALLYLLARDLAGKRVALAAALVASFSPFHIYYSQEARMYALLGFFAVATVLFFTRAWQRGGLNWAGFSVSGALLLYTHNLGVLFQLAVALWTLYAWQRGPRWHHGRQLLLAGALMLLLYAPWLFILPRQLAKLGEAYWIQAPGLTEVIQTLFIFHFAYDNQALPPWLLAPALFLSLLLPLFLALQLARQPRQAAPARFPHSLALLLLLSLGVVLLAFLISQVRPVYIVRALLPATLFYYVLLVSGLRTMPRPVQLLLAGAALLVAAASLWNHYTYNSFPRAPFAEAVAFLKEQDERVVHSNKLSFLPAHYYAPLLAQTFIGDEPGSPGDTLHPATQRVLGIAETDELASALPTSGPVWLVIFEQAITEYEEAGHQHPHLAGLEQHYGPPQQVVRFADLLLYHYR